MDDILRAQRAMFSTLVIPGDDNYRDWAREQLWPLQVYLPGLKRVVLRTPLKTGHFLLRKPQVSVEEEVHRFREILGEGVLVECRCQGRVIVIK